MAAAHCSADTPAGFQCMQEFMAQERVIFARDTVPFVRGYFSMLSIKRLTVYDAFLAHDASHGCWLCGRPAGRWCACRPDAVNPACSRNVLLVSNSIPAAILVSPDQPCAIAARIGGEQHAVVAQGSVQLFQHTRQLAARHMKQRSIGEDAIEAVWQ